MFDGEMVFPIVGQGLVEAAVFFLGDVRGISSPQGLGLVQFLSLLGNLLDFFGLFLLVGLFIDLFNLGFLVFVILFSLFFLFLDFFLRLFGDYEN